VVGVVACNCSALTAVMGVGDRLISEMTREPVTTTDYTGADAGWAYAEGAMAMTLAAHNNDSLVFMVFPPIGCNPAGRRLVFSSLGVRRIRPRNPHGPTADEIGKRWNKYFRFPLRKSPRHSSIAVF